MLDSFSSEELVFIKAIEKYKAEHNKHFLSWTEVLKVMKDLGYRRISREACPPEKGKAPRSRRKAK